MPMLARETGPISPPVPGWAAADVAARTMHARTAEGAIVPEQALNAMASSLRHAALALARINCRGPKFRSGPERIRPGDGDNAPGSDLLRSPILSELVHFALDAISFLVK